MDTSMDITASDQITPHHTPYRIYRYVAHLQAQTPRWSRTPCICTAPQRGTRRRRRRWTRYRLRSLWSGRAAWWRCRYRWGTRRPARCSVCLSCSTDTPVLSLAFSPGRSIPPCQPAEACTWTTAQARERRRGTSPPPQSPPLLVSSRTASKACCPFSSGTAEDWACWMPHQLAPP